MSLPVLTSTLIIRLMQLDDLPQVLEIDRQSFSLPWSESAYRFEINNSSSSLALVVEEQPAGAGQIVALVVIWLILDEAHIATIAVRPEARRQGIARVLMVESLRECIARGARSATLEVRASNLAAQALYRSLQFKEVGRRARYYHDNQEDALLMTVSGLGETYLRWLDTLPAASSGASDFPPNPTDPSTNQGGASWTPKQS